MALNGNMSPRHHHHQHRDASLADASAAQATDYDQILLEPYTYLMAVPGKNVRGLLVHAFNRWLMIPAEKLAVVEEVINMLHTASLLYVGSCIGAHA